MDRFQRLQYAPKAIPSGKLTVCYVKSPKKYCKRLASAPRALLAPHKSCARLPLVAAARARLLLHVTSIGAIHNQAERMRHMKNGSMLMGLWAYGTIFGSMNIHSPAF